MLLDQRRHGYLAGCTTFGPRSDYLVQRKTSTDSSMEKMLLLFHRQMYGRVVEIYRFQIGINGTWKLGISFRWGKKKIMWLRDHCIELHHNSTGISFNPSVEEQSIKYMLSIVALYTNGTGWSKNVRLCRKDNLTVFYTLRLHNSGNNHQVLEYINHLRRKWGSAWLLYKSQYICIFTNPRSGMIWHKVNVFSGV